MINLHEPEIIFFWYCFCSGKCRGINDYVFSNNELYENICIFFDCFACSILP